MFYFSLLLSAANALTLMEAVKQGKSAVVNSLLDAQPANAILNEATLKGDQRGWTVLMEVAKQGKLAVYNALYVNAETWVKANVNASMWSGRTALMVAAEQGNLAVFEALCAAGADVNQTQYGSSHPLSSQSTALTASMRAIGESSNASDIWKIFQALLTAGANVHRETTEGALIYAVKTPFARKHDIIQALLDAGVDVNAQTKTGWGPLMFAIQNNDAALVEKFLNAGAETSLVNVKGQKVQKKIKERIEAQQAADHALVQYCRNCAKGDNSAAHRDVGILCNSVPPPNVNGRNVYGRTALMEAAIGGKHEVVEALLANGADANVRERSSRRGRTALECAKITKKFIDTDINNVSTDMDKTIEILEAHEQEALEKDGVTESEPNKLKAKLRRRLVFGELPVCTLVLVFAVSLLLLGYLVYHFKRRLTAKRQPVDTDLTTDLESGPAPSE